MSITETQEYKTEREKEAMCPFPKGAAKGYYLYGHKKGAEFTEGLLTTQHDKEMEEFEKWMDKEGWFIIKERRLYDAIKPLKELLALFRNRNK